VFLVLAQVHGGLHGLLHLQLVAAPGWSNGHDIGTWVKRIFRRSVSCIIQCMLLVLHSNGGCLLCLGGFHKCHAFTGTHTILDADDVSPNISLQALCHLRPVCLR
jgi:hypothetical protein